MHVYDMEEVIHLSVEKESRATLRGQEGGIKTTASLTALQEISTAIPLDNGSLESRFFQSALIEVKSCKPFYSKSNLGPSS